MLNKRLRLTRSTFPTPREGRRLIGEHFSLSYGPSKEGGCAAVVSKQVAKRSVDRHLLKRRMLSVLRPWCKEDRFLIAYARSGSSSLSFGMLKDELQELLTKTHL